MEKHLCLQSFALTYCMCKEVLLALIKKTISEIHALCTSIIWAYNPVYYYFMTSFSQLKKKIIFYKPVSNPDWNEMLFQLIETQKNVGVCKVIDRKLVWCSHRGCRLFVEGFIFYLYRMFPLWRIHLHSVTNAMHLDDVQSLIKLLWSSYSIKKG